ncbi:MAG: hypothetical protein N2043_02315 [Ignavibacterium sp.]|nr:hypothetical protein [Ignavibacterium sp.]
MGWLDSVKNFFTRKEKISVAEKSASTINRDPKELLLKPVGLTFDGASREASPPEFDLSEIEAAYDAEAYVRQAVDKYIEFMFKAGWDFIGDDPEIVKYIQQRFDLMSEMTAIPTSQLFIEIAEDLVKFHNCVIVKQRDANNVISSIIGTQVQGLMGLPPVAGYYILNMTTVKVLRDKYGTVKRWEQEVEGSDKPAKFKPEDVIHIYYKREKGKAFGKPFLLPVIGDIRALRQAEENVLKLVYRNIFPYIHVIVGTENLPATEEEVRAVQSQIENGSLEDGLVTSERVKIVSVASDKVIDAEKYLRYFEQRVFTGLGVPELLMGRGNTANRATGDNMASDFIERVKAYQKVMETFINNFMIKELLMEAGYDPLLNEEHVVEFRFREIDLDAKVKKENHAIFKYEHNAITEDEMRDEIGKDPITDRATMYMNLVSIPLKQQTGKEEDKSKETDNKNKPENQHGVKSSPKRETNNITVYDDMIDMKLSQLQKCQNKDDLKQCIEEIFYLYSLCEKKEEKNEQVKKIKERIFDELEKNDNIKDVSFYASDEIYNLIEKRGV